MKWIDERPEWDDDMFDGDGGYKNETEYRTIICDKEYEQIEPWPGHDYWVFSHDEWCAEKDTYSLLWCPKCDDYLTPKSHKEVQDFAAKHAHESGTLKQ